MLYITVKDNCIEKIYCSGSLEEIKNHLPNADIREVPETFSGVDGESLDIFDSEFNRLPVIEEEESGTVVDQE